MISQHNYTPAPDHDRFDDVLLGLRATRKRLPCRLLYDARGAELFEQICTLEEYYLTRTELGLLDKHLPEIASGVGARARVIEPGSGAGHKTRMLLTALDRPASYFPIDVSQQQLEENAAALRAEFPGLVVEPVHGDYLGALELPSTNTRFEHTVVFFPGSTIGNLEPAAATMLLARLGALAGSPSTLVLGADSNQDPDSVLPAYDDSQGVTAAFNVNVLAHVNRTYDATFDPAAFLHRATWDPVRSRIEMHLVSRRRQTVMVRGESFKFERGEPIVTEHCYKYAPAVLDGLIARAGWLPHRVFADAAGGMRLWVAVRACT